MQVKLNDEVLFEITETDILLLQHAYLDADAEIRYRVQYFIKHACDVIFADFQKDWLKKLSDDPTVKSVPVNRDEFVKMIIARPEYKNWEAREQERLKKEQERNENATN